MESKEEKRLPEAKEITIRLDLNEAKDALESLPPGPDNLKKKIRDGIREADFWNFKRNCEYLEFFQADIHITGIGRPGWHTYCKHPENKRRREKLYIPELPEDVKSMITGDCRREYCPVYKA